MSARKVFCGVAVSLISLHLIGSASDWFSKLAESSVSRRPVYSRLMDLDHSNTFLWKVPTATWPYTDGEAMLGLVLDSSSLHEIPFDRSQVHLRVKVAAYAVRADGTHDDRLLINDYYTTDEPFSEAGRSLWERSHHGRIEYGLGGIQVRPGEELVVEAVVSRPDPVLALGNPRLKLIGHHDAAGLSIRNMLLDNLELISLGVCFTLLAFLWWCCCRATENQGGEEK